MGRSKMTNKDQTNNEQPSFDPAIHCDWQRLYPPVVKKGLFRVSASDFMVRETLSFEPSGSGEHCFLLVEKVGANTQWVAKQLAKLFAVKPVAIGYSGLKDRHSVSQQWFSVHLPGQDNPK